MINGEIGCQEYYCQVTSIAPKRLEIDPALMPGRIVITVETAAIRYRYSGEDPLPGIGGGHPLESGGTATIEGAQNIVNFRMVADTVTNANVFITLETQ